MLSLLASAPPAVALSMAIICEVFATSYLPKTEQFTQPLPTALVLGGYGAAFYLLAIAVKTMPLGIAYAIWCGAGIVLVAGLGWLVYGQKLDIYAVLGIALILAGTAIINLFSQTVSH